MAKFIELNTLTLIVTATFIPFTLFLIIIHPVPVEDCPCFEDSVAFVSVFAGILVGRNLCHDNFGDSTIGDFWGNPFDRAIFILAFFGKISLGELRLNLSQVTLALNVC